MILPGDFAALISKLPAHEVSYGCFGIKVLGATELEKGQIGYSRLPDGKSLCGDSEGDWRPSWVVIGYVIGLGDPVFIDSANPGFPVFTSIHGEGNWKPDRIAISIEALAKILHEFANISTGRANPVELEEHPLSDTNREVFLARVDEINEGQIETDFWGAMLEEYG